MIILCCRCPVECNRSGGGGGKCLERQPEWMNGWLTDPEMRKEKGPDREVEVQGKLDNDLELLFLIVLNKGKHAKRPRQPMAMARIWLRISSVAAARYTSRWALPISVIIGSIPYIRGGSAAPVRSIGWLAYLKRDVCFGWYDRRNNEIPVTIIKDAMRSPVAQWTCVVAFNLDAYRAAAIVKIWKL